MIHPICFTHIRVHAHTVCTHIFFRGGEKYGYFTFLLTDFLKTHCISDFWDDWHWTLPALVSNWIECGCSPRRRLPRRASTWGSWLLQRQKLSHFWVLISAQYSALSLRLPEARAPFISHEGSWGPWFPSWDKGHSSVLPLPPATHTTQLTTHLKCSPAWDPEKRETPVLRRRGCLRLDPCFQIWASIVPFSGVRINTPKELSLDAFLLSVWNRLLMLFI